MIYRVEVTTRPGLRDGRGESILRQAAALGIEGLQSVVVYDLYFLEGALDEAAVCHLADTLLHDPVAEVANVVPWPPSSERQPAHPAPHAPFIEVTLLPGVTDSVAESLLQGARLIGVAGLARAATGRRYEIQGHLTDAAIHRLAEDLLVNTVIQSYSVNQFLAPPFLPVQAVDETVAVIPLTGAGDQELEALSRTRRLSLDLAEMQAIQAYYRRQGREPTDVELEMLAQTWSEHCVHKTFRATINYIEVDAEGRPIPGSERQIESLLKTCLMAATEKVGKPWLRSAFVDNAGIIAFNGHFDLAFKVETHNHPSALEPFGGANTGVGGVIRDIIGVSAWPIANTDVLCFGPPDLPFSSLPAGVLHPRRIAEGVTAGIEDYGNKMGIPTVNGAILYDPGYTANPLVFCGCLGLVPRGAHRRAPQAGDLIVVLGGRTGRDGLRGATFSSMEMDHQTEQVAGSAVQIGHPINEKKLLEAVMAARDEGLYHAITDCGGGGLSSAVGEMASELGAEVYLDRVPLKYAGLQPWEIWLSEAQERMVLAVPAENWPRLQEICQGWDVEATVLGHFTGDGRLTLRYGQRVVGELDCDFLHHGIPRRHLRAVWQAPCSPRAGQPAPDLAEALLTLLALPETRSKEDVVRRYDHEVQAATVVKPFVGRNNAGPSDAAVLDLAFVTGDHMAEDGGERATHRGVALACGINPHYGLYDPYAMAWAAVDEAVRNCVAVGADPDYIALLDNFCWGNPNLPDRLGGLMRCALGCHDAAIAYGTPFISGKDSLNNEYMGQDGTRRAIPGTLLISAVGIVPDVRHSVTMDLKSPGNLLYVVGVTRAELGGSSYERTYGPVDVPGAGTVPQPTGQAMACYRALHQAMRQGLVRACHDCSEGGLAVALAEMALAGGCGAVVRLADLPRAGDVLCDNVAAFSESLGRMVVEVAPEDVAPFEALFSGLPLARVGFVTAEQYVWLLGLGGNLVLEAPLAAIEQAWRGHIQ